MAMVEYTAVSANDEVRDSHAMLGGELHPEKYR